MVPTDRGVEADTVLGIAEGLDLVFISENELLIQFGTRSRPSELLRDPDVTGILQKTVGPLLHGPATLSDLIAALEPKEQAEARELLGDLIARGIVTDLRRTPVEQYLRYTFTGESSLADRSVSLIGTGPIGMRIAQSLLLHGIVRLVLLDDRPPDALWTSFLPPGHRSADASSRPSSDVLRETLRDAGHRRVESLPSPLDLAGVEAAVTRSDLSVVALERPNLRLAHIVNRVCLRHRKPWVLATIDGNFGLAGPLFLPFHTACYNDYRVLVDAATPSPSMARKHRQHIERRVAGSFSPGLPAYAEIVAGFSALGIVHFLLRGSSFVLGRVLVTDFDRMTIEVEDVLRLPRCPVCGRAKGLYRPAFAPALVAQPQGAPAAPPARE